MSVRERVRSNWRVLLLVVLLLASAYFLFVPGAPIAGAAADGGGGGNNTAGATNLQYGIQLAGGARITAPVEGSIATDVGVTDENADQVVAAVANATRANETQIVTSANLGQQGNFPDDGVEVRAGVSDEQFAQGLRDAGLDASVDDIGTGVSGYTRQEVVETLDERLGQAGFGGGSVTEARGGGRSVVEIESPGYSLAELEGLVSEPGLIEVYAHVPAENEQGYHRELLYTQDGIEDVGTVNYDGGDPYIPVTLTPSAADEVTDYMQESGFAQRGAGSACEGEEANPGEWCLVTEVDGEPVYNSGVAPSLANSWQTGEFRDTRQMRVFAGSSSEAQELRINMRAGALPAPLDVENGTSELINPALAEGFRTNSLIAGVLAVLAVVLTVFARYGDPKVAVPMAATALSEVIILLGFAAAIGWALELSHVAGFIAVIGTGVDDLIIIADEVKAQGEVTSERVFQNRFRKAFWVIGAAAATTIVAMSPLAILDLGQLRGFAIITILGVVLGVAVSRPAYGSILRSLTTQDHR